MSWNFSQKEYNEMAKTIKRDNDDSRTGSMFGGNAPVKYGDVLAAVNRNILAEEAKNAKLKSAKQQL